MTESTPPSTSSCANCGAALAGPYCAACGQSRDALAKPFLALAVEWIADVFSWDGRLIATTRELFAHPGRVARDYVAGKRVSHTPPIRLFLLATALLLAVMSAFDMRLIAISQQIQPDRVNAVSLGPAQVAVGRDCCLSLGVTITDGAERMTVMLTISMFVSPDDPGRAPLPEDVAARLTAALESQNVPKLVLAAVGDRDALERSLNAAGLQALFAMIAGFALLCAAVHPRRPLLVHAVHSLYFHAAVAIALSVWIGALQLLGVRGGWAVFPPLAAFAVAMAAFDRGGYGTSWLGLVWRLPLLLAGYSVSLSIVLFVFTILLIPR